MNVLLNMLTMIGLVIIPFIGIYHEANAVVIPIILPLNSHSDVPTTCTQINSTVTHCVPDPPSPSEQLLYEVFLIIIIIMFGIVAFMVVRLF